MRADHRHYLFSADVRLGTGGHVVMLAGELDMAGVTAFDTCIARLSPRADELVLDFGELRFIDASGLHAIAGAAGRVAAGGGSLTISSPRPACRRLLDLVGFERIVTVRP